METSNHIKTGRLPKSHTSRKQKQFMKQILLVVVLLISLSAVKAQNPLVPGKNQLNIGVGLSEWGVPVYIGFDHGLSPVFTIGAELSYRSYKESWKGLSYRHGITGISGNLNYHFNQVLKIPKDFDFYAGANVGFYMWTSPEGYDGSHSSGLGLGGQIGGRYYFNNKLGINLEVGGGNAFSGGKFGLTIKL
jgi:outer membrane immunogenic protein